MMLLLDERWGQSYPPTLPSSLFFPPLLPVLLSCSSSCSSSCSCSPSSSSLRHSSRHIHPKDSRCPVADSDKQFDKLHSPSSLLPQLRSLPRERRNLLPAQLQSSCTPSCVTLGGVLGSSSSSSPVVPVAGAEDEDEGGSERRRGRGEEEERRGREGTH
eukprot:220974-Hanusia_phi.AAC.2